MNRQEIKRERRTERQRQREREDRDRETETKSETEGERERQRERDTEIERWGGRQTDRVTQREGQFGLAQSSWRAESLYDNLPTSKINHRSLPLSPIVSKLARPPN